MTRHPVRLLDTDFKWGLQGEHNKSYYFQRHISWGVTNHLCGKGQGCQNHPSRMRMIFIMSKWCSFWKGQKDPYQGWDRAMAAKWFPRISIFKAASSGYVPYENKFALLPAFSVGDA